MPMSDGTLLSESDTNAPHAKFIPGERIKKPDRSKCHWEEYEIGTLLKRLEKWDSLDEIAQSLGRSVPSCRREYERLLRGEAKCPEPYPPVLQQLQRRVPRSEGHCQSRRGGRFQKQSAAQYKHLAGQNEKILAVLTVQRRAMNAIFAHAIDAGKMEMRQLRAMGFSEDSCHEISEIVKQLGADNASALDAFNSGPPAEMQI